MNTYDLNDTVTLANTFTVGGVATDPTAVTLSVETPSGTTTAYTYGAAQITKDSTGVYHKNISVSEIGVWSYQWTGTGTAAGVEQDQFYVEDALAVQTGCRSTMVALVRRVRRETGDTAGANQVFNDYEVQEFLDGYKYVQHGDQSSYAGQNLYETLRYYISYGPGAGTAQFLTYESAEQWWESDAALVDSTYGTVTPTTSDYLRGRWTFASTQAPPLRISGKTYDVYAAGADLCEAWAGRVATDYDFSTDQQSFSRSQKMRALMLQADRLRSKARMGIVDLIPGDLAGDGVSTGYEQRFRRTIAGLGPYPYNS